MSDLSAPQYVTRTVGDTLESLRAIIRVGEGGEPYDLTGCTVTFRMVDVSTGTVVIDDESAVVEQVEGDATTTGMVRYDWADADVDTAGRFYGAFTITNGGKTLTLPTGKKLIITLMAGA